MPAFGQSEGPFEFVDVGVSVAPHIASGSISDNWSTAPAYGVHFSSPFYVGVVSLEANYSYFRSRGSELTDFWSLFVGAGWGPELVVEERFTFQPSLVFGNAYMHFVEEPVDFRRRESEFYYGIKTLASVAVGHNVAVGVSHQWTHTFTSTPIRLSTVGAHVRIRFGTPSKVVSALK